MNTLGIVLLSGGLLIVLGFLAWGVVGGIRQKRQVDRNYRQIQAQDRALETRVRASLASSR